MSSFPTKKLYNDWEMISSEEGNQLLKEIEDAIKPIVDKYAKLGYPYREIEYVVNNTISVMISCEILKRNILIMKEERIKK